METIKKAGTATGGQKLNNNLISAKKSLTDQPVYLINGTNFNLFFMRP
jgi:hypothetical protein